MTLLSILIAASLLIGTLAQTTFDPTLTINSCTNSSLDITLYNASDSGIVYIQGQSAACRLPTTSGISTHSFDFRSCNIEWVQSFKLIVQKKALYQTGADKQIPVMCVADLGDLTVSNSLAAADKADDLGQNLTVKPSAFMTLYKDGVDISGQVVKLTDIITMVIALDSKYNQDFDIKVKYCAADTIDIITDGCAADTDLFPHMSRISQGTLQATFGAFRTTNLNGGTVGMPFSCTLQVCLGLCTPTVCTDGSASFGRKKRSALSKRQAESGSGVDDISVGTAIRIATEEDTIQGPEDDGNMCMNQGVFVAIVIPLVGGTVVSAVAAVVMFRKFQEKASLLSKLGA
ncbi:uncharacterized protein LOC127876969 [Dreissena polymorpha]|uniref:uncharacterized protein LOC127876969 n=1 Tax=Dreissena polymorpha TaxID=45954 RepID=UPI002263D41C|nr:uncharacterized protein LOC127876969 [Dreissena polymorpha]